MANPLKRAFNKVVGKTSDYIANNVMLQPSLDRAKGVAADKTRQRVLETRKDRQSQKYTWSSDGKMKVK